MNETKASEKHPQKKKVKKRIERAILRVCGNNTTKAKSSQNRKITHALHENVDGEY